MTKPSERVDEERKRERETEPQTDHRPTAVHIAEAMGQAVVRASTAWYRQRLQH